MKKNRINELYDVWFLSKTPSDLDTLILLVHQRIVSRYRLLEPELCEDIAQTAIMHILRSLYGQVTRYSKQRGSFAAYCAMTARGTRKDMLKHERLTATQDEQLVPLTSDIDGQEKGY
jgi:DNA-directed RNA polymerase specialized sigma24 family protein